MSQSLEDNISVNFEKSLGKGTFGDVYRGRIYNDVCAVKKIQYRNDGSGSEEERNKQDMAEKEIKNMSKLNMKSHKNILKLLFSKHEEIKGYYLLFLEFCNFGNLKDYMQKSNPNEQTKIDLVMGCCNGLDFMHTDFFPPMLHTDIKPQNILVREQEGKIVPKLSDFSGSAVRGTKAFWSPELFQQLCFTDKTDVFAMGLLISLILCFDASRTCNDMVPCYFTEEEKCETSQTIGKWLTATRPLKLFCANNVTNIAVENLVHQMVAFSPNDRPPVSHVAKMIGQITYQERSSEINSSYQQKILRMRAGTNHHRDGNPNHHMGSPNHHTEATPNPYSGPSPSCQMDGRSNYPSYQMDGRSNYQGGPNPSYQLHDRSNYPSYQMDGRSNYQGGPNPSDQLHDRSNYPSYQMDGRSNYQDGPNPSYQMDGRSNYRNGPNPSCQMDGRSNDRNGPNPSCQMDGRSNFQSGPYQSYQMDGRSNYRNGPNPNCQMNGNSNYQGYHHIHTTGHSEQYIGNSPNHHVRMRNLASPLEKNNQKHHMGNIPNNNICCNPIQCMCNQGTFHMYNNQGYNPDGHLNHKRNNAHKFGNSPYHNIPNHSTSKNCDFHVGTQSYPHGNQNYPTILGNQNYPMSNQMYLIVQPQSLCNGMCSLGKPMSRQMYDMGNRTCPMCHEAVNYRCPRFNKKHEMGNFTDQNQNHPMFNPNVMGNQFHEPSFSFCAHQYVGDQKGYQTDQSDNQIEKTVQEYPKGHQKTREDITDTCVHATITGSKKCSSSGEKGHQKNEKDITKDIKAAEDVTEDSNEKSQEIVPITVGIKSRESREDFTDIDYLCIKYRIKESTFKILKREGFDKVEDLKGVTREDLQSIGIPLACILKILKVMKSWNGVYLDYLQHSESAKYDLHKNLVNFKDDVRTEFQYLYNDEEETIK